VFGRLTLALRGPREPLQGLYEDGFATAQNESVPVTETLSTSCRGDWSSAQLRSGLRGSTPCPSTDPVNVPLAAANEPVPPVITAVCATVTLSRQLSGFSENEKSTAVLTRCIVPSAKTRSSRTTLSGSPGGLGISTILPAPVNTPLATIELASTSRSPDVLETTSTPLGNDLIAYGGATLDQGLSRLGLVDEYRLMVQPAALGAGLPLFKDLSAPLHLELVEATTYATGVAIHVYRPRSSRAVQPVDPD
jgi:RibD domain-containing protein